MLGFQKQLRLFQNPPAYTLRRIAPGGIDLAGLPGGEPVCGKRGGHALALVQAHTRHRYQTLHRHMGGDGTGAHFLLNAAGKKFHQSQPPANPTGTAVETPRQIFDRVAEALLQFGKQPALFDRRLSFRQPHRPVQYQRLGFVHLPDRGVHRVPAQLLQCPNTLVAVDDQVTVRLVLYRHDDDRNLLPGAGQRCQQPPQLFRTADPQMLQSQIQLMKLQLHSGSLSTALTLPQAGTGIARDWLKCVRKPSIIRDIGLELGLRGVEQ